MTVSQSGNTPGAVGGGRRSRRSRVWRMALSAAVAAGVAVALVATQAGSQVVEHKAKTKLEFEVVAASDPDSRRIRTVGVGDAITYGTARLTGPAAIGGRPFDVEILLSLHYLDGSGPFTGWWTLTDCNGDRMAFSYKGETENAGSEVRIRGRLRWLGGTGRYLEVTGNGKVVGVRVGPVGGTAEQTVDLRLEHFERPECSFG